MQSIFQHNFNMYFNIISTYFNNINFNISYFNIFNPPGSLMQSAASPCDLRARARGRAGTGSGRPPQPADRPTSVSTHYLRVSQTGQQTSADRQVWGTDSDTSRRRSDRRSGTTARDTDLAGPDDSAW